MGKYYIYIMASISKVLYTGVSNDLERRVREHKEKFLDGFTKRYNVTRLVYFEESISISQAIIREKQIKGWLRSKKVALIEESNSDWRDLSEGWYENLCEFSDGTGDSSLTKNVRSE